MKMNDFDFSEFDAALDAIPKHQDFETEKPSEETPRKKLPCRVDDLDLQRPPGFVGRVADWIDAQCRYPRRKLAVASAIVAVGNIGGLRHEDSRDGMTANMMAFCVAASSTGKEAVMQAFTQLHVCAGIQGAVHGGMKSEQEIMRNVIDQQASFYSIDEIGIFLTKVRNAQKRGGNAAYLEGIFGAMMSVYSKADSRVLLGGDVKRELRKVYAAQLGRAQEDGDEDAERKALKKLEMVDAGLERPFMSLIGYTTPSTFDGVMDGETATQGLVGRAIIVNETEVNPRPRHGFKKAEMPMQMAMRLHQISGRDAGDHGPVEWRDDRTPVPTDPEASELLVRILDWLIDYANDANEETGEASVAMVRRSFEMVGKISFIMGIADGVRTVDHVRWAFAYVRAEVDAKIALVFANDNERVRPEDALAARIMARLDAETGKSVSVLANSLKVSKAQIEEILAKLEASGAVAQKIGKRTYRGQKIVSWFLTDQS